MLEIVGCLENRAWKHYEKSEDCYGIEASWTEW
jgi:hypothetical protein